MKKKRESQGLRSFVVEIERTKKKKLKGFDELGGGGGDGRDNRIV
jgi:hypothetical protein